MAADSLKKKSLKKMTSQSCCRWCDLSPDVLCSIFLRLGSKDRFLLRSVCKSCHLFRMPHFPEFSSFCKTPSLIIPRKRDGLLKLFHPISNNYHSSDLDFPQLIGTKVLFSKFGWLLVCSNDDEASIFFLNPFTREMLKVPSYIATWAPAFVDLDFSSTPTLISGSFSSPPTHSDCCICVIYGTSTMRIIGRATLNFGIGDKYWFYKSLPHNIAFTSYPILKGEAIYYMDKSGDVNLIEREYFSEWYYYGVEIYLIMKYVPPTGKEVKHCYMLQVEEIVNEDHEEIGDTQLLEDYPDDTYEFYPYDYFNEGRGRASRAFIPDIELVDSDKEEFIAVYVLEDTKDNARCVLVKKLVLDIPQATYVWKSVNNLGNKCLYVGNNGSFLVEASQGKGNANTIYFNYLYGENGVSYSLTTENWSGKLRKRRRRRGTWIKPEEQQS